MQISRIQETILIKVNRIHVLKMAEKPFFNSLNSLHCRHISRVLLELKCHNNNNNIYWHLNTQIHNATEQTNSWQED